jgi:putative ABC transport system permease protein
MNAWSRVIFWLRAVFHRQPTEAEMDAELRFHLDRYIEDLVCSGVPRKEASRRARLEFGGLEQTKEYCRDAIGTNLIDSLIQDIRFGLRMLRNSPAFTIAAVLTIALGVGANSAIFGLIDSTILRRMPFSEPERLMNIWTVEADGDLHTPIPAQYKAVREQSKSFSRIAAAGWSDYFYGEDGSIQQSLPGFLVTANWLPTLGIQPLLGRNFRDDEQNAGQDAVVLLSYDCWQNRFRADPRIIGQQIILSRRVVTVIGILPQSLGPFYRELEIFAPLVLNSDLAEGTFRAGKTRVEIFGRLKPDVTLAQARAEMEVIASRLRDPNLSADRADRLVVQSFAEQFGHPGPTEQNARRGLSMTAMAAGVVLLIACANVGSLILARGVRRQREIAVRAALGCSRARMIRQLLTETSLLFLCGGTVALFVTQWCAALISNIASGLVPGAYLQVNAHVFLVTLAISLVCALIFGLIPALVLTRVSLNENLKDTASKGTVGGHPRLFRHVLVGSQVALGMMLLVCFGLLLRSLLNVEASPIGYDPRNVLTVSTRLPATGYTTLTDRARFMEKAAERMRAMPGVESVGIADSLPMEGADSARLRIDAPAPKAPPVEDEIWFVSISPDYFSTLRVAVVAGRSFMESEGEDAGHIAIINETFAKKYFPNTNPIGYHLAFANSPSSVRQIVGVVSDFRQRNPEEDMRPLAYFPISQMGPPRWSMAIRVRAAGGVRDVAAKAPNWLQSVDPQLYWKIGTMQQLISDSESLTMRRPIILLVGSFGGLAVVLVVIGVFGITSYSVAERTREIGIRIAVGASRNEIAKLVLLDCLQIVLVGLATGASFAFALARLLPTEGIGWSGSGIFLYNVSRTDGLTYFLSAAVLAAVALAASWSPARHAMRVDPMVALRYE